MLWTRTNLIIFALFVLINSLWLHHTPGLFGDEASEGQNVYDLLHSDKRLTVMGERSYIGPLIDYIRIPFVLTFGYNALALRSLMLLASIATFFLTFKTFTTLFGPGAGPLAAVTFLFSPTYLLYQRLGWAISLFPFFAMLLLYLILHPPRQQHRAVITGAVAGLGLHNHLIFFPTLLGIILPATAVGIYRLGLRHFIQQWWPALLGFLALFGSQFTVMQMFQEDQGRPWQVVSEVSTRLQELPAVLPQLVSGSVYLAHYSGHRLPEGLELAVTGILTALVITALFYRPRPAPWLWAAGLGIHLSILLLMIDRFTLRYFVMLILGTWALAGYGLDKLLQSERISTRAPLAIPALVAAVLVIVIFASALLPFRQTGGGLSRLSLDDPNITAEMMVDINPLINCLRTQDEAIIYTDDIHIYNRLIYLQYDQPDLQITDDKKVATVLVRHRSPKYPNPEARELCPYVKHFWVIPYPPQK